MNGAPGSVINGAPGFGINGASNLGVGASSRAVAPRVSGMGWGTAEEMGMGADI